MAQKTKRTEQIILRVSPAEKALILEGAKTAGLKVSEYARQRMGIGHFGRADLRRAPFPGAGGAPFVQAKAAAPDEDELAAYVAKFPPTLPMATRVRKAKSLMAREALTESK